MAAGHRPPLAGAREAPQAGPPGGPGTRGLNGAGRRAAPSRRGAGGLTESLCVPADPPAGGRDQSASVSLSLTARGLPPPRRALTQSGTDTDTRFARDAAGFPPPPLPPLTHPPPPPPGRERPGRAGRLGQRARGWGVTRAPQETCPGKAEEIPGWGCSGRRAEVPGGREEEFYSNKPAFWCGWDG